ncbi:MAG: DUF4292 domain-containing protein [Syntrophales bacterium LBB04]|nr:DUF4292 domain-containing protein [Syntrophales bacterium LBB04]
MSRPDYMQDTLKAIARIEINSRSRRYPLKIALMLKRPAMLRIETIPVIGPTDFFMSLTDDALKVFIAGKNTFYQGLPTKRNISIFFPISLDPEDLVSVMMGIPPISGNNLRVQESLEEKKRYRIELFSDHDRIKTFLLSWEDDGRLSGMEILGGSGDIINTITYSDYRKVGEIDLPHQITILSPEDDATIVVRYVDVEFSKGDESFDLPISPDVKPIIIDSGSSPGGSLFDGE